MKWQNLKGKYSAQRESQFNEVLKVVIYNKCSQSRIVRKHLAQRQCVYIESSGLAGIAHIYSIIHC